MTRYLYQVHTEPQCGAGVVQIEIDAESLAEADATVVERHRAWLQQWADHEQAAYTWTIRQQARQVGTGVVRPAALAATG